MRIFLFILFIAFPAWGGSFSCPLTYPGVPGFKLVDMGSPHLRTDDNQFNFKANSDNLEITFPGGKYSEDKEFHHADLYCRYVGEKTLSLLVDKLTYCEDTRYGASSGITKCNNVLCPDQLETFESIPIESPHPIDYKRLGSELPKELSQLKLVDFAIKIGDNLIESAELEDFSEVKDSPHSNKLKRRSIKFFGIKEESQLICKYRKVREHYVDIYINFGQGEVSCRKEKNPNRTQELSLAICEISQP